MDGILVRKILVVDDEPAIREMLITSLGVAGFECLEAADIQDAYWLITDQLPDLVLLDWMLPGASGIELLKRLRKEVTKAAFAHSSRWVWTPTKQTTTGGRLAITPPCKEMFYAS